MVDINKYLETQLALAKRKKISKDTLTHKSATLAENITKKQKQSKSTNKPGTSIHTESQFEGSESDYLPSDDEDDVRIHNTIATLPKPRHNLRKIIDDGDTSCYDERLNIWQNNIQEALSGNFNDVPTADIKFIMNGSKNYKENHDLQNGLSIPNYIWKQLYIYQRTGVKWLWELHQIQSGGLLGDEMGLGKTVQIIAFLAGLSETDSGHWGGLGPSIIVAPATVMYQWVSHFHYWRPNLRVAVLHNSGSHSGNHHQLIRNIHLAHGILLVTYSGVVKYSKELQSRKWHYLILDEGHKIRNPDTQVSKIVKKFATPHRIIISGSPMQNNLQELWSLYDFIRPGLLGSHNAFMDHIAVPITQGGYANASQIQEATAFELAKALKNMISPYLLRRTKAEVQDHIKLPDKNEQVLFCALSQEQKDLYLGYLMSGTVRSILDKENKYGDPLRAKILVALSTLRKICNHPDLYLYEAQEASQIIDEDSFGFWKRSGKMSVVHSLLKIWQKQGHRALIFSQSRAMICILEQFLQQQDYKYIRMDGTTSVGQRQNMIKTFNEDESYLVFLATTRVGGLGVNLTGADRVIIYDPDWNPATDSQAKERAWRIGQLRNVTIYRLISAGTIEEKIYQRQVFKHLLSNKVFIDPSQKNFLTTSTLQGLFTLEDPNEEGDTETSSIFKHTKVSLNEKCIDHDKEKQIKLNEKLKAMRQKAKEISRKIANEAKNKNNEDDARKNYKQKRDLLCNPPIIEEPEINLVNDQLTNEPFENVLSELDIINKHTKKDYEETLINKVLKAHEGNNASEQLESNTNDAIDEAINEIDIKNIDSDLELNEVPREVKKDFSPESSSAKHKRKYSSSNTDIKNLVAVKKIKTKKRKKNKLEPKNDDDYVLNKLFAKSAVKNALHHDAVVGLAEKERKLKIQEEASKKAKDAVKAMKFSCK